MSNDKVKLALQELREKAIEAHASSDGPKVNHLCSVALDFILAKKPEVGFLEVRWVFILSAYWTTNSFFLDRTTRNEPTIQHVFEQDKDHPIVGLFGFVSRVLQTLELPDFPKLSIGEADVDAPLAEDSPLYELAFELYWFFSQGFSRVQEVDRLDDRKIVTWQTATE